VLLLPNHPAFVDPIILLTHFFPHLQPHILADRDNMARPLARWLTARLGVKPIPD
jgi:1-acyl-sn-glycerol-3-phosphate acyltransferase